MFKQIRIAMIIFLQGCSAIGAMLVKFTLFFKFLLKLYLKSSKIVFGA